MPNTVEEYLDALRDEMKDADPALTQDALSDAREHFSTALEAAHESNPGLNEANTLQKLIDEYGTPEETAAAYKEVERRTSPVLKQTANPTSALGRFFGVYADPRAWGALLYMFIAFITGILYFTWVVTGLSLSVSLSIFIFGLPLAILFLLSVRGLTVLEGRLVEALLGIRMPRRPLFTQPGLKWMERLKQLLLDKHTWLSILYMLLQFVLGTIYFIVITVVLSLSLAFIALPFFQEFFDQGAITFGNNVHYFFPVATYPLFVLGGYLLWTAFMNLVRGVGQLHGRMAKWMLVSE
jgi:hypothetical protein